MALVTSFAVTSFAVTSFAVTTIVLVMGRALPLVRT